MPLSRLGVLSDSETAIVDIESTLFTLYCSTQRITGFTRVHYTDRKLLFTF